MKIIFLGVGEAFDENLSNSSILIEADKTNLLLDCGYSMPQKLWLYNSDKDFLDAIFISHFHADHYFGLPAILLRMWVDGRKKPIKIIFEKGNKKMTEKLLDFAYKGFRKKFLFKLEFIEVKEGDKIKLENLELKFANTLHSSSNIAVKVSDGKNSICYSGDGMFKESTEKLYYGSDLVIHESYLLDEEKEGHANAMQLIEMAKRNNIKSLALTHISRKLRKDIAFQLKEITDKEELEIIIPEPSAIKIFTP